MSDYSKHIIKCPHCGWEYLPDEIFMPGDHIGKSEDVVKDALGKILYADFEDGRSPDQRETFVCDGCGKAFVVEAETRYKAKPEAEERDFSSDSASLL